MCQGSMPGVSIPPLSIHLPSEELIGCYHWPPARQCACLVKDHCLYSVCPLQSVSPLHHAHMCMSILNCPKPFPSFPCM